jgi:hypothetical protein
LTKQILIIHPYDKSTSFLERIKNHLQSEFQEDCHYFNIKPHIASHKQCLLEINNFSNDGLILFMGHGKSNCLYGAKGDYYGTIENELVKEENPEKYFYEDNFINDKNINIFKDKKVISLSCNSNGQIGRKAIEFGAKVFLGFGDLPTSVGELEDKGEESKTGTSLLTIEQAIKTEINYIIKKSIEIGVVNNYSFVELVNLIHFISNQRISDYLVNQKKINERKLIANYIYDFKKEIKIYGNKNEKLIDL